MKVFRPENPGFACSVAMLIHESHKRGTLTDKQSSYALHVMLLMQSYTFVGYASEECKVIYLDEARTKVLGPVLPGDSFVN